MVCVWTSPLTYTRSACLIRLWLAAEPADCVDKMSLSPEWRRRLTLAYLARLARSKRPILLGPWRSEVGFEVLYWLPFLRWWARRYAIDPGRLVTVTRGGAAILYGTAAIDLYRLRSVDTVRLENAYDWQSTKLQKQTYITAWDRTVLRL